MVSARHHIFDRFGEGRIVIRDDDLGGSSGRLEELLQGPSVCRRFFIRVDDVADVPCRASAIDNAENVQG